METYRYLHEIAHRLPEMGSPKQLRQVLDGLEFWHEALEPELPEPTTQLVEQITRRLKTIQDR